MASFFQFNIGSLGLLNDLINLISTNRSIQLNSDDGINVIEFVNYEANLTISDPGANPGGVGTKKNLFASSMGIEENAVTFYVTQPLGRTQDSYVTAPVQHTMSNMGVGDSASHYFRDATVLRTTGESTGTQDRIEYGYVRTEDSDRRVTGFVEEVSMGDTMTYFHIRTNNLVYDIKNDSFTRFSDIDLSYSYPLIKGSATNNVALCLIKNNNAVETIKQIPGSGQPEYANVRTKDYFIEHGVFQAYNVNYDTETTPTNGANVTTITKNADSGEEIKAPRKISEMKSNKWGGYFPGGGYGFIGSIVIQNVLKVKDLILKYKLRLEE